MNEVRIDGMAEFQTALAEAITDFSNQVENEMSELLTNTYDELVRNILERVKSRTGALANNIGTAFPISGDIFQWSIICQQPYSGLLEDGTNEHSIQPRGDYPLHFYWEKLGAEVWSDRLVGNTRANKQYLWHGYPPKGRVEHPGFEPRKFGEITFWSYLVPAGTDRMEALMSKLLHSLGD